MFTQEYDNKGTLKEIDGKTASRLIAKYNERISTLVYKLMTTNPEDNKTITHINNELQGLIIAKNSIEFRSTKEKDNILKDYHLNSLIPFGSTCAKKDISE